MDVQEEIRQLKRQHQQATVASCCCQPAGTFWGTVLLLVGGVWLLASLGLAADLLWSLFFVGLGLYLLLRKR